MFTENKFSHLHNLRNYIKFFTHSLYFFLNNKNKFTRKSFSKCLEDKIIQMEYFQSWMENSNSVFDITFLWIISNKLSGETKFWLQIIIRINQVFGWKLLTDPPNFTNKSALSFHNNPSLFQIINLSCKRNIWNIHKCGYQSGSQGDIYKSCKSFLPFLFRSCQEVTRSLEVKKQLVS